MFLFETQLPHSFSIYDWGCCVRWLAGWLVGCGCCCCCCFISYFSPNRLFWCELLCFDVSQFTHVAIMHPNELVQHSKPNGNLHGIFFFFSFSRATFVSTFFGCGNNSKTSTKKKQKQMCIVRHKYWHSFFWIYVTQSHTHRMLKESSFFNMRISSLHSEGKRTIAPVKWVCCFKWITDTFCSIHHFTQLDLDFPWSQIRMSCGCARLSLFGNR